jgi:hypothetical protein
MPPVRKSLHDAMYMVSTIFFLIFMANIISMIILDLPIIIKIVLPMITIAFFILISIDIIAGELSKNEHILFKIKFQNYTIHLSI